MQEFICRPQHLNINIKWQNEAASKIVFGLFRTKRLLHFRSLKTVSPDIVLKMRLVEKEELEERQHVTSSQPSKEEGHTVSDNKSAQPHVTTGSALPAAVSLDQNSLDMELTLFFDFGLSLGALSLVCMILLVYQLID